MFWKIAALPQADRDRLAAVSRAQRVEGAACWFRPRHRPGRLALWALVAVAAGVGLAAIAGAEWRRGAGWNAVVPLLLSALALAWGALLLVELARAAWSPTKPFLLLTPAAVLRCDYEHGFLEGHRLRDATDFKTVDEYGSNQRFAGRRFDLRFGARTISWKAAFPAEIERLEGIVAAARSGGAGSDDAGAALLPTASGAPAPSRLRELTNPFGAFWLVTGAFLLVGLIVVVVVARR